MSWKNVFFIVTGCSLGGMVLGGLFGLAAGSLVPTFFKRFIPWEDLEPTGFAVVLGGTGGVFLGGALGVFAVVVQLLTLKKKADGSAS